MAHLEIEEIIEFVSFDKLTDETLALASKVNGHMLTCAECRKTVAAFQEVYDELCRIGHVGNAKECIYQFVEDDGFEVMPDAEVDEELQRLQQYLQQ